MGHAVGNFTEAIVGNACLRWADVAAGCGLGQMSLTPTTTKSGTKKRIGGVAKISKKPLVKNFTFNKLSTAFAVGRDLGFESSKGIRRTDARDG